jgi:hypothetical protein
MIKQLLIDEQFYIGLIIFIMSMLLFLSTEKIIKWIDKSRFNKLVLPGDKPEFRIFRSKVGFGMFALLGLYFIISAIINSPTT